MPTIQERCIALTELARKVDLEEAARVRIKYGDEFTALNKKIAEIMEQQADMLEGLADSRPQYQEMAKELMEVMKVEKIYNVGNVSAKFREKNEVNTSKVMNVLGGDIDLFVSLANITQAKLKDFSQGHPQKSELLGCVETVSKDIVDLTVDIL